MNNIKYVILNKENVALFKKLILLFEQAFEIRDLTIPATDHLSRVLGQPNFLAMVALDGESVLGGLTGHVLPQYYEEAPQFYLYDLAVAEPSRRQGVASGLLQALQQHCQACGYACFYVQADADDDTAVAFYRSTVAQEQAVFHYTFDRS
jgi:aminoglycoside 3-N-acetyltransferase I